MGVNMDLFLDESKSLNEGAILFPGYAPGDWEWNILNESRLFDMDKKIADYTKEEKELLLYGKAQKVSLKFGGKVGEPHLRRARSRSSPTSTSRRI